MSNSGAERPTVSEQFYRQLLELHGRRDVEPLVADALKLIVEASAADIGYLELFSDEDGHPRFWKSHGLTEQSLEVVRARISQGVIAFAIAEGRSIRTASALRDDVFKDLGSVKQNAIEAVLCVPVGIELPLGVLYLQGRHGAGAFTDADGERAETFARQVALVASRLLGVPLPEETRVFAKHQAHEALRRRNGNMSEAARDLGIGRAWLRKVLRGY